MTHDPLFDLPDVGKRDIPRREDHPLLLAWIRPCSDPLQRCEQKNCTRPAYVEVAEYEDWTFAEAEMKKSQIILMHEIEDKLWRHTLEEQLGGKYTVYQTCYWCRDYMITLLMRFLNTKKHEDITEVLDGMRDKHYTLVQYHRLSYPEMGLCAIVPERVTTPNAFLDWLKSGVEIDLKLQR